MENWQILYAFTYPHETQLVRSKLESEGIETIIQDEETVQVINLYSDAIGGVKLLVKTTDFDSAQKILIELGYVPYLNSQPSYLSRKIDFLTKKVFFLKNLKFEIRLLLFLVTLVVTMVGFVYLFFLRF